MSSLSATLPLSPISLAPLAFPRALVSLIYPRILPLRLPYLELLGKTLDYSSMPMIAIQDIDLHLHRRRPWARAFTSTAIKDYSILIEKRTRQLMSRLEEQHGVVRLDKWIDAFTSVLLAAAPEP